MRLSQEMADGNTLLLTEVPTLFRFPWSKLEKRPFSVPRFRPGRRVTFSRPVSLGSFQQLPFLGFSSFSMTLAVSWSPSQVFR